VERAFQIIECLVELGEASTAYHIAKTVGAPLSTVYDIIGQLEKMDVLRRTGNDGKFFLGSRLLMYGLAYTGFLVEDDVYRLAADELCRRSGENVHVCIRDGDCMVVAAMAEAGQHFYITSRPGSRSPLNWSASGRLLIGHLTPEQRSEIFSRAKPSPNGRAVTDPEVLERECREAWEHGYCIQTGASGFSVACIAAGVINNRGECCATMSLVVPESVADVRQKELVDMALNSVRDIERQLGYQHRKTPGADVA
jgi:Transcriptional regulator